MPYYDWNDRQENKTKFRAFDELSIDEISDGKELQKYSRGESSVNGNLSISNEEAYTGDLDIPFSGEPAGLSGRSAGTSLRMLVEPRIIIDGGVNAEAGAIEYELGYKDVSRSPHFLYDDISYSNRKAGLQMRISPWSAQQQGDQWFTSLFPYLPPAEQKTAVKEPKMLWSAEARALAQSLLCNDQLAQLKGGLEISRTGESFDVRWGDVTSRSETLSLVSPQAWLIRSQGGGLQTIVQWCNDKERGIFSKAFQLGRLRTSTPADVSKPPVDLGLYTLSSLEKNYPQHQVELKSQGDNRTLLVLKHPSNPHSETDIMIDTQRHVILWIEDRQEGKVTSSTKCDDLTEAAGAWWAGRIETFDAENRLTSRTTQKFKPLSSDELNRQIGGELAHRDQIQFLHEPLPKTIAAKQAIADAKATFDDQVVLMLHFAQSQQWNRAIEHLNQAEKLSDGKTPMRWVRSALLNVSRRREELKQRTLADAGQLAQSPSDGKQISDDLFLANHLLGQSSGILEANEMLALLDVLKPVFERQPQYLLGMKQWNQQRANYLQQTGRSDQWLALQKQLAEQYPHDANLQQQYAQNLANTGDYEIGLCLAYARTGQRGPLVAQRRRIAAQLLCPIAGASRPLRRVGRLFERLAETEPAGRIALPAISQRAA